MHGWSKTPTDRPYNKKTTVSKSPVAADGKQPFRNFTTHSIADLFGNYKPHFCKNQFLFDDRA